MVPMMPYLDFASAGAAVMAMAREWNEREFDFHDILN